MAYQIQKVKYISIIAYLIINFNVTLKFLVSINNVIHTANTYLSQENIVGIHEHCTIYMKSTYFWPNFLYPNNIILTRIKHMQSNIHEEDSCVSTTFWTQCGQSLIINTYESDRKNPIGKWIFLTISTLCNKQEHVDSTSDSVVSLSHSHKVHIYN